MIEGQRIVMKQILRHTGTLCLPVQPQATRAVMEMIPPNNHVDRRMHLDTADLCSGQVLAVIDVMNMVIFDHGEHTAQMADDTGLSAVVNIASADNMRPDPLFRPSFRLCLADAVPFRLRAVLDRKSVV